MKTFFNKIQFLLEQKSELLSWFFVLQGKSNSESNNTTFSLHLLKREAYNNHYGSDSFLINSPIETSEINSPLQTLLLYSLSLDLLMLFIFFIILFLLFQKYYGPLILSYIKKIIYRYCSNNTKERLDKIFNLGFIFSDRFVLILLIINILNLIFIVFLKIYLNSELYTNIDNYVSVYNEFTNRKDNKSVLFLLGYIKNMSKWKKGLLFLVLPKLPKYLPSFFKLEILSVYALSQMEKPDRQLIVEHMKRTMFFIIIFFFSFTVICIISYFLYPLPYFI